MGLKMARLKYDIIVFPNEEQKGLRVIEVAWSDLPHQNKATSNGQALT